MKFLIPVTIGYVSATTPQMQADLSGLISNSSMRQFTGATAQAIEQLDEYGCWCYFYDNVGRGKGQPVDEVDGMCKTLNEGYECAIRDTEEEGNSCTPWEVSYISGTGSGADLFESCVSLNADSCAARACAVEGNFVEQLFALFISGNAIDYDQFGHSKGFDAGTDAGCPVKKGTPGTSGAKGCCGAYPGRFPFKTLDGERDCCGTRTFNTNILSCCSNGQVKAQC